VDLMRDIHIHIDEVVLDGVALSDPDGFRAALAEALTGLVDGHRGGYPSGVASVLHGTPVAAPVLGQDVARSVWASLIPGAGGERHAAP
jgi:hypothetical protein